MRELELDGIHDDGEHLVLIDSDGERYTLRSDEALRAAVRRDRPALGMIRAAEAGALRPRDIQTMLRSGRSAEEIAEMSELPVDHVRRYEGPVLAEREWIAQRARTFPVGRGGPALDQLVAERLAARQASRDTAWDAWRHEDGTWALELTFSAAGRTRQAHWTADMDNRTVTPTDDEARWISDADAEPEPTLARARLKAVRSSVYDVEADGSFEDGAPAPRRTPVSHDHPAAIDEAELDALNARRGLRSVPQPVDEAADLAADDDEDAESVGVWSSLDDPEVEQAEDPDQEAWSEHSLSHSDPDQDQDRSDADTDALEDAGASPDQDVDRQDTVDLTPLPGFEQEQQAAAEQASKTAPKKTGRSRSKRASMPSWDEIVFGSKND